MACALLVGARAMVRLRIAQARLYKFHFVPRGGDALFRLLLKRSVQHVDRVGKITGKRPVGVAVEIFDQFQDSTLAEPSQAFVANGSPPFFTCCSA